MSRHLRVVVGDNWAEFRGYGSRELYVQLFRRPPIYNTRTRSWCTVPSRIKDIVAAAEHANYDVTVTSWTSS